MPLFDQTGPPLGQGAMTGRRQGIRLLEQLLTPTLDTKKLYVQKPSIPQLRRAAVQKSLRKRKKLPKMLPLKIGE